MAVTGESTTVTSSDISAGQRFTPHRRTLEVRSSTRRLNFQTCAANITSKIKKIEKNGMIVGRDIFGLPYF